MKKILEKFADIKIKVYLCNMYKLILILLFSLWGYSYGQQLIINPFQQKMDSISISKLNITITQATSSKYLISYNPFHRVLITIKTGFNRSLVTKLFSNDAIRLKEATGGVFNDLQFDDYANILRYSIRCKVYVNRNFRLMTNIMGVGVGETDYFISTGIIYKY